VITPLDRAFRRILVALDDSAPSNEALLAAAALAARVGAHLEGLFVEDVNLLRAAALPFASEISVPSGALRRVDRPQVEAQLRAVAAAACAALAAAARPQRIAWSFRVARGQLSVALVEAATTADLLVLGRHGHRAGATAEQPARTVASRSTGSVFVTGRGVRLDQPLAIAYDGSPSADDAVDVVRQLDLGRAAPVTLLVSASSERRASQLAAQARGRLARDGVAVRWTGGERLEHLVQAARRSGAGALLVVGTDIPLLLGNGLEQLLDAIDGPFLLVR
jgi:nucleotide-binding universal stress UspA family protein